VAEHAIKRKMMEAEAENSVRRVPKI